MSADAPTRPDPARTDPAAGRRGVLRRRVQPVSLLLLTLLWVLLWGNVSWINVVSGLLLATLVLVLFPLPPLTFGVRLHPWGTLVLVVRFLVDLVVASVEVAYKASVPWEHPQGRLTRVPLRGDNDLMCTITAQMTTLVPGSIVIDIDCAADGRSLLLHLFDAPQDRDVQAMHERVRAQELRVLRALAAHPPQPTEQP